jgi:hypothetical protein
MTNYRSFERQTPRRSKEPHPVWRGIGCVIMLIVPALAMGISYILIQMAPSLGVSLPVELLGRPVMPGFLFRVPGLVSILVWIQSIDNLYGLLAGTFAVTILLGGLLALVYAIIYRILGPAQYSGVDAPPIIKKVKKYKR